MIFAMFKDTKMIYSPMKSNLRLFWFREDRQLESPCGSGGTGTAGTVGEWCLLQEIWQNKAQGEECGLQEGGQGFWLG